MATVYTTTVNYDLTNCPSKMDEIYTWFNNNGQLAETAALTFDANIATLVIVNCSGDLPPSTECSSSTQTQGVTA